ncbi:MAG: hypothetical protein K2F83_07730 [Oscillospiraceae bacterium]|nr:hypothetical protein [Oscillospiraceae bacterium]
MLLREGDYVPNGQGGFQRAEGAAEVLERVLWKLTVKRGSFPFLPELGSRLHLLNKVPVKERETMAARYAHEALANEEVTIREAKLTREGERGILALKLDWQGEELTATVEVGGLG